MPDQIRGPSREATAEIIARFANAGRDDPTIAARLEITVDQVRGIRAEFNIPPGETRWSHGHQRPPAEPDDDFSPPPAPVVIGIAEVGVGEGAGNDISLEELLAHTIRMRDVNKAVRYDVRAENERVAGLRAQIRERDAK